MQIARPYSGLSAASLLAVLATFFSVAFGQVNQSEHGTLYYSLDGQTEIRCLATPESAECGLHRLAPAGTGFFLPESIHYDCSDDRFLCVSNLVDVFAVPRKGLEPGMHYSAYRGASLVVEQCFRKVGNACLSALISSECAKKVCDCYLTPGKRITYFYYEKGRGVVGFGNSGKRIATTKATLPLSFLSSFFVLGPQKGFLEAEINLSDARGRSGACPK